MENNNTEEVVTTSPKQGILSPDTHVEAEENKRNALIGIGVICLFVLLLAVAFLFSGNKGGEKTVPVVATEELQIVESVAEVPVLPEAPPVTFMPVTPPETTTSYPTIVSPSEPLPPTIYPYQGFGVALISGTLAFDLNQDGVLTNADVATLSQIIGRGEYVPLFDFDSDGVVNINDLAMIRAPLFEYPVVCYDVNDDQVINMGDIAIVSQIMGRGEYVPLFDFDADGIVGIKDLALIRAAVAEDGSVNGVKR